MTNKVLVSLKILGFSAAPEEVTRRVGLEPTKTWQQGDLIPRTTRHLASSGWEISASDVGGAELSPQMEALFGRIQGREASIAEFSRDARIELSIVVYAHESVPALHLPRETVEYLNRLHSSVDIDLYCLIEEEGHED
ncbi:MAG TPA: DUF4279 domain-containing protein [Thermoanaerobaculia bacterium]|jgi:hypothetical protein